MYPLPLAQLDPEVNWHSAQHVPERTAMMRQVLAMLIQGGGQNNLRRHVELPNVARRLELFMYRKSASFEEYIDHKTLKRRLKFLVTTVYRNVEYSNTRQAHVEQLASMKAQNHLRKKQKLEPVSRHSRVMFLLNDQRELIHHVFSFLSEKDVIKCWSINSTAKFLLRDAIFNLRMTTTQANEVLTLGLLQQLPNLHHIEVYVPLRDTCDKSQLGTAVCPTLSLKNSNYGEWVVKLLASILVNNEIRNIKVLSIRSAFVNTHAVDATRCLGAAIKQLSNLEVLQLGGNSIGDDGMCEIAEALEECSTLKELDLRSNYIGEKGFLALCRVLLKGTSTCLEKLLIGNNILNNRCSYALLTVLSMGRLRKLRVLGLDDNFLGGENVAKIQGYLHHSLCPDLECITTTGNDANYAVPPTTS